MTRKERSDGTPGISRFPRRAIHLDFHTMPAVPDVGADFDAEKFASTLADAHVDFITVFARCNLGFAYYPTKVGIPHPSLRRDLLGEMVKACHRRDVGVVAYINAGLDHEHALRHRDWSVVNRQGQVCGDDRTGSFFRIMCFNTGYREHLLSMIREVLALYPVEGLFLDCWCDVPCYGHECLDEMRRQGKNVLDDAQVLDFSRETRLKCAEAIREIVPRDKLLYFNGMPLRDKIRLCSHVEIECLPTAPEWGYDAFPLHVRYARNFGKPVIYMTGRFQKKWGDFGGIRPPASLEYDCFQALSEGVGCSVGDHMHPRGRLEPAVYRMVESVYRKVAELEPWTNGSAAVTEMAVLSDEASRFGIGHVTSRHTLVGAARMLSELHLQFGFIDPDMDFSPYRVLVLPDDVLICDRLKKKLKKFLKSGGAVLSSFESGLDPDRKRFALGEWGAEYKGPAEFGTAYFRPDAIISKDMPDLTLAMYEKGIEMKPAGGVSLASVYRPYFDVHWDGFHGHRYAPPQSKTDASAIVQSDKIIHVSFPIFLAYRQVSFVAHRTLVRNLLRRLLPDPVLEVENFPSFGRVGLTEKEGRRMIHLLAYCPEMRGDRPVVEEPVCVRDVTVRMRSGKRVRSVCRIPEGAPFAFTPEKNGIRIRIPELSGHLVLAVE